MLRAEEEEGEVFRGAIEKRRGMEGRRPCRDGRELAREDGKFEERRKRSVTYLGDTSGIRQTCPTE